MATNSYFNQFSSNTEQTLIENLIVEAIKIYGHDMYYLPRTGVNKDATLNEWEYSEFNTALPCEFYIKSSSSFEGQGQLLEKFGLQIKDQLTLQISVRSFNEFIKPTTGEERPLEGDLIYIPMIKALYEVNYLDKAVTFFQLGSLQSYDIVLELYESNNDKFATGIAAIDDTYNAINNIVNDPFDQGDNLETEGETVLDFTEKNPFTDLY
jgi:hypothetical protein